MLSLLFSLILLFCAIPILAASLLVSRPANSLLVAEYSYSLSIRNVSRSQAARPLAAYLFIEQRATSHAPRPSDSIDSTDSLDSRLAPSTLGENIAQKPTLLAYHNFLNIMWHGHLACGIDGLGDAGEWNDIDGGAKLDRLVNWLTG